MPHASQVTTAQKCAIVLPCNTCIVRESVGGNVSLRAEALSVAKGRRSNLLPGWGLLPFDKLRTGVAEFILSLRRPEPVEGSKGSSQ